VTATRREGVLRGKMCRESACTRRGGRWRGEGVVAVGGLPAEEREKEKRNAPRELHLYMCWGAKERSRQASGPLTERLPARARFVEKRRLTQQQGPSQRPPVHETRAPRCRPLGFPELARHRKGTQHFVRCHPASPSLPAAADSTVSATRHSRTWRHRGGSPVAVGGHLSPPPLYDSIGATCLAPNRRQGTVDHKEKTRRWSG